MSRKETKNKERFNRLSLQQPEKVKIVKKPGLTIREKRKLEELAKSEREDEVTEDEITSPSPRTESRRDLANSRAYRNNAVRYSKPRKSQVRPHSEILESQNNRYSVSDSELLDDRVTDRRTTRRDSDRVYGASSNTGYYISDSRNSVPRRGSVRTEVGQSSNEGGWLSADQGWDNMADQYTEDDYYGEDPAQTGYNYNVSTYKIKISLILETYLHNECFTITRHISTVHIHKLHVLARDSSSVARTEPTL